MSNGALSIFMKIGLIAESMAPPRKVTGIARIGLSIVAVAFSYFFIHIAFFGPPVTEIFKGTFLLGVIVLSILLFKGRQRSLRQGFVWLDELFAVFDVVALCAMLAVGAYWWFIHPVELWREFVSPAVWLVGGLGAIVGLAIYAFDALREKTSNNPSLSDVLYLIGSIAAIWWWIDSAVELTERIGGPVPVPVVFFSGILAARL